MGILQARILEWVAMPSSHIYIYTLICCSVTWSCPTLCDSMDLRLACPTLWDPQAACQASLSLTVSQSLPKLLSVESVMPSSYLVLCCSLRLLPSIFPNIRVFSNELALRIRWPKCVCIYIYFLRSYFFPYRPLYWVEFLVLYSRSSLVIYFIYSSMCQSQSPFFLTGNHKLVFYICDSISVL